MGLLIIFGLICLFLLALIIFLSVQFYYIFFRGYAPFISSSPAVIAKIISEINLRDNSKVYELGCGKAGFLRAVAKKFPRVKCLGVENSPWPYLRAKIQAALSQGNIKIINNNLFKVNLADANLIYCYLNSGMMKELEEKFKQECKQGTQIISYDFFLPNMNPQKVVQLDNGGKIYFYTV